MLCVNVLEHLDRPDAALAGFKTVLAEDGNLLILVPAHQWLYSAADEALGHRLRYDSDTLRDLVEQAGFEVVSLRQFNRLGVLGWLVNKWFQRTSIGGLQARVFGWLLPLARALEKSRLPGLSWIVVAKAL